MKLRYLNESSEYPIGFSRLSDHVVYLKGDFPVKAKGFELVRDKYDEAWDYSDYNTIYRTMLDGAQFSDDGSTWVEPTKTILVQIAWNDEDDIEELRPASVDVEVSRGNEVLETVTLSNSNGWKKEYEDVESAPDYTISAPDVEDYELTINGTTATYYHEVHHIPNPSIEERVTDLEAAVCEIADAFAAM